MKKIVLFLFIAIIPLYAMGQDKKGNIETVKYVTSIDCDACVSTIMKNLPQEKGIKDVKCDLKTKEVTVSYQKDKNNPDEIKKSLEKLGYTAKVVKTETPPEKK